MRSLLRRYRELVFVAALLAAPLLVYAVRGKKPARLNWVDRAVVQVTAPVERLIVLAANGVIDGFQSYVWLRHVREDNLELRRHVTRQEQEVLSAQEIRNENERLRRVLGLKLRLGSNVPSIAAEVVAVGASPHSHTIRIARGSRDGIQQGAPVVSNDGVVGTVAQLADGYADVQLITSPFSAVPALNQRTRGRSTVKGTGDFTRARLEYALRTEDLQESDLLLSAGGAGQFPKGLRVGRVVEVQKKAYGLFQQAYVVPAVDFSHLDEVVVIQLPPEEKVTPVEPPAALVAKGGKQAEGPSAVPAKATIDDDETPKAQQAVAPMPEKAAP